METTSLKLEMPNKKNLRQNCELLFYVIFLLFELKIYFVILNTK